MFRRRLCGEKYVVSYIVYQLVLVLNAIRVQALRRTFILFWLGMFLANGYELKTWRIPGTSHAYCIV